MATATVTGNLTTGEMAERIGVPEWKIRAACKRGLLAEPSRHGPFRLWREQDVPRVRAGLVAAGYLAAEGER